MTKQTDTMRPWQSLKDAAPDFGYKPKTAENMAREKRFPCPIYKLGGKWVVDLEVKAAYFEARRKAGLAVLAQSTKSGRVS